MVAVVHEMLGTIKHYFFYHNLIFRGMSVHEVIVVFVLWIFQRRSVKTPESTIRILVQYTNSEGASIKMLEKQVPSIHTRRAALRNRLRASGEISSLM